VKKTLTICFIGIDGSGKSTLSRYLFEELKRRNYSVSYTWWLEGDNSLLRRLLRRIGKSKHLNLKCNDNANSSKAVHKDKSITTKIFRVLYPRIVLLDYLRFGMVKAWLPKIIGRSKVIIFDRFVYDVIFALSREFDFPDAKRERLFKLYSKLLPNPDLIFIIDVPPEVSYLRKKEEIGSVENAKALRARYQELYSMLNDLTSGKIMKINNTPEIEIVKAEILKATLDFLEANKNGK